MSRLNWTSARCAADRTAAGMATTSGAGESCAAADRGFVAILAVIACGVALAHVGVLDERVPRTLAEPSFFVATPALMLVTIGELLASQLEHGGTKPNACSDAHPPCYHIDAASCSSSVATRMGPEQCNAPPPPSSEARCPGREV